MAGSEDSARTGLRGRCLATRRAVAPDSVHATMSEAPMCSASSQAAPATASGRLCTTWSSKRRIHCANGNAASVSSAMRFIVATAASG